jgi:hypothetical protein
MAKAVLDTKDAKPLGWLDSDKGETAGWLTEAKRSLDAFDGKTSELPKVPYQGKLAPLSQVMIDAEKGSPEANLALRQHHINTYLPNFARAKQQGVLLDALGRRVKPEAPVAEGAADTVSNQLETFQQKLANDDAAVRAHLGDGLVDNLKRFSNPARFEKAISTMSGILDGSTDVQSLRRLNAPVRNLLKQLGLEPDRIPVGLRKVEQAPKDRYVKYVSDLPPDPNPEYQAMLDKMGTGSLTETQHLAEDSIRDAGVHQYVENKIPEVYKTRTNKGALRTSTEYGEGSALLEREFNTYSQMTQWSALAKRVGATLRESKVGGAARAQAFLNKTLPALRLMERFWDAKGVPMHIGVGDEKINLYLSQIFDSLNAADKEALYFAVANGGTRLPITNLLDAVVAAVGDKVTLADGVVFRGPEAIRTALRQTTTKYASKTGSKTELDNEFIKGGRLGQVKKTGDQLVEQLSKAIEKAAPALRAAAQDNSTEWLARTGREVAEITDQTLEDLNKLFTTASTQGSLILAVDSIPEKIQSVADLIGATQKATDISGAAVQSTIAPYTELASKSYVRQMEDIETLERKAASGAKVDPKGIQKIKARNAQERMHAIVDEVHQRQPYVPGGSAADFGEDTARTLNTGFLAKLNAGFNNALGEELLHENSRAVESMWHTSQARFHKNLAEIQSSLPLAEDAGKAVEAYRNIQKGLAATDPKVAEIMTKLQPLVGQIFGGPDKSIPALVDNAFFREGIGIDHANSVLDFYGLGKHLFDTDAAERLAKTEKISMSDALARQWREHEVEDPIDYLSKMYKAFSRSAADQTIVGDFIEKAHALNAISSVPRKGFSRVEDTTGRSALAAYMPSDVYIEDTALRQLQVVDTVMRNSLKRQGPIWEMINNYYIPFLDMWKWGNTLPNPSHHARNFVGDTSLTLMANGVKNFRKASKGALQAMASRNAYDGYDAVKALQGIHELPNAGKVIISGKLGDLTSEGAYAAAYDRGNLPTFQQLEQLETSLSGTSSPARAWERLTDTKGARFIGGVSEGRDHYVRLVHFIQYVDNHINMTKRYKNLDALLDEAAAETRKWHPDGSDLTNAERVFKLAIPFYSWTRKAIPLVAESVLTRPGRVNAVNKASYNLALAMGVNPQSLSDPFPDDQMFPSFLTDQATGPQFKVGGKYFGVEPGIATTDVLNTTVAGNLFQNVIGQTAPIIKMPFELSTGRTVGTGGEIHDWSDYLDSQIPGVAQASRLSGTSVTGSLASLLQGKGLDPQYQVAAGNKDVVPSIVNYLTGLGITPMSQPNQISYAQFEQANKANNQGVKF